MMEKDMAKMMSGAPKKSMRPKRRPEDMDEDMAKMMSGAPKKSMRPRARPKTIGASPSGQDSTRGVDPEENYGEEEIKRLSGDMPMMKKGGGVKKKMMSGGMAKMKKGGGVKKMMHGGMAKSGYKAGGKVRGYGMARGGKACKMR